MAKILSKFGEQQLVMVNYACGFNQSETGKYFELITMRINSLCRIYLFPQTEFIGSGAGYFTSKFSMSEDSIKFISPRAIESVKSIPVKVGDTFTIAEYGCADGGTSMPLMYACVKELRSLYGSELEVHVNYEDKPDNDFKSLFYFLQGKEKIMRVTK